MPQINVCGLCEGRFGTVKDYLLHVCGGTGLRPANPNHLGASFARVSISALKRGAARAKK